MSRRNALLREPTLSGLLGEVGLKFVDIGGRGSAFAPLVPLAPLADYFVSEPDQDEADRLTQQLPLEAPWRSVRVFAQAIASTGRDAPLFLTAKPGMSSLLEPDPRVAGRFYSHSTFKVVRTTRVPTVPLDDAASEYGFSDATFLKIDTQGTELDILQSGPRLVGGSLLGVHVESLFQPIYKGQSLFADVDTHLRRQGFVLFTLSRTSLRRAGYRESLYSKRMISWAHCLYLREPDSLLAWDREHAHQHLLRLLGIVLSLEFYDLAFEIMGLLRGMFALPVEDVHALSEEVERIASAGTRRVLRQADPRGLRDVVMASNFRDKGQLE